MEATGHINHHPASSNTLDGYRVAQDQDQLCATVKDFCRNQWPPKTDISISEDLKPYWDSRGELTVNENLLLCGGRIVVPTVLREEALKKLHQGHQGRQRCRLRAQSAVWWPSMSTQLADMVKRCYECTRDATPNQEPLIPTALPSIPGRKWGLTCLLSTEQTTCSSSTTFQHFQRS